MGIFDGLIPVSGKIANFEKFMEMSERNKVKKVRVSISFEAAKKKKGDLKKQILYQARYQVGVGESISMVFSQVCVSCWIDPSTKPENHPSHQEFLDACREMVKKNTELLQEKVPGVEVIIV